MKQFKNSKSTILVSFLSLLACLSFFLVVQSEKIGVQVEANSTKYIEFINFDGRKCKSNQESHFVEITCEN